MLAAVAYLIALAISLVFSDAGMGECLGMAAMPAAFAFVAAMILIARDHARQASALRKVRQTLLARRDVNEAEFLAQFAESDSTLVLQVREAIALFFDVPVLKVFPTDQLRKDFRSDILEPAFHSFVLQYVLELRNITPRPYAFHSGDLTDLGDLVEELRRIMSCIDRDAADKDG